MAFRWKAGRSTPKTDTATNVFRMLFYGPLIFSNFLGQKVSVVCSEVNWLPFPFFFVFVFYFSGRNRGRELDVTGNCLEMYLFISRCGETLEIVSFCFVLFLLRFRFVVYERARNYFTGKLSQTGRRREGSFSGVCGSNCFETACSRVREILFNCARRYQVAIVNTYPTVLGEVRP